MFRTPLAPAHPTTATSRSANAALIFAQNSGSASSVCGCTITSASRSSCAAAASSSRLYVRPIVPTAAYGKIAESGSAARRMPGSGVAEVGLGFAHRAAERDHLVLNARPWARRSPAREPGPAAFRSEAAGRNLLSHRSGAVMRQEMLSVVSASDALQLCHPGLEQERVGVAEHPRGVALGLGPERALLPAARCRADSGHAPVPLLGHLHVGRRSTAPGQRTAAASGCGWRGSPPSSPVARPREPAGRSRSHSRGAVPATRRSGCCARSRARARAGSRQACRPRPCVRREALRPRPRRRPGRSPPPCSS